MKTLAITGAVAALLSSTQAIKVSNKIAPDVFGPEGENYRNNSPDYEMSRIGVDIHTKGDGKNCKVGDWAKIHYVGSLIDGRVVTDTHQEHDGLPVTYSVGKAEVLRCLDLGIEQLQKGTKATLHCPSFFAWGDAFTWPPVGGDPIPLHSDVNFEVEVLDCNRTPEFTEFHPDITTTTMQPGRCMYLHQQESEDTYLNLVLSTQDDTYSKVWPAKYAMLETKVVDEPAQQWFYDDKDGSIYNAANPTYSLENDEGWVMMFDTSSKSPELANNAPTTRRAWFYDSQTSELTTMINEIKSKISIDGELKNAASVSLKPSEQNLGKNFAKFRIEYCYENQL